MAVVSTLPSGPELLGQAAQSEEERLTPARLARENTRHDRILAGLLVVFTFLLVSFPVTNADIWTHLRTGKMIVEGDYRFGVDPFSYTTEGVYWANTGWLSDVLFYGVYDYGGGAALVLMRGAIILVMLALLFGVRRRDGSLFVSVAMLGLAAFAMSQRLFVRTELLSLLLMALTLYLLWKPADDSRTGLLGKLLGWTHGRAWVFLPLVFAVWANLDAWFFLGPLLVGLVLAGEWLQTLLSASPVRRDGPDGQEQRTLLVVLLAGIAACFLNPHHYHVWQIPAELTSSTLELIKAHQPNIRVGISPFDFEHYFSQERLWFRPRGLSFAEWSYYVLVAVSALSFIVNAKGWSWARVLLWTTFFGLSAWQVRGIAFFAVVAGPVTVLNLHDWLRSRFGSEPTLARGWVAAGQLARIALLFLLVGLASALLMIRYYQPGMQQEGREAPLGILHQRGALGWSMLVDPSLKQSAERLADWCANNALPGRGFSLMWEEQPAYASWFDPEGKSFMDTRYRLHEGTVNEFYDVYLNLRRTGEGPGEARDAYWQDIFRKYNISHLIVSSLMTVQWTDPETRMRMPRLLVDLLLQDRDRDGKKKWEQLDYSDGRTFILAWTGWPGWKDPRSPHFQALERVRYNPEREAFTGPTRLPPLRGRAEAAPVSPLRAWLSGEIRRRPIACDEAIWHIAHAQNDFRESSLEARDGAASYWLRPLTMSLAGVPVPPLPIMTQSLTGSAPILAVRAARRAIADNPLHPDSYYWLFVAYRTLRRQESFVIDVAYPTRDVQMIAALHQAALLEPSEELRHIELADWYFKRNVADLGIDHYQAALAAIRLRDLGEGDTPEEREKSRVHALGARLNLNMELVEERFRKLRANYNQRAVVTRDPLERAQHALALSLINQARLDLEQAIQRLPAAPPFQPRDNEAFRQLMQLYLQLGFLPEAMMLFARPDAYARLQPAQFHRVGALIFAADGNYEVALKHRQTLDEILQAVAVDQALSGFTTQLLGGENMPAGSTLKGLLDLREGVELQRQRADLLSESGLLALEAGQTALAAEFFRRAMEDVHERGGYGPLAGRYYRLITGKWLSGGAGTAPTSAVAADAGTTSIATSGAQK